MSDFCVVDDLLRVAFREGGRDPAVALDCWGLVVEVRRRLGLPTPDPFADGVPASARRDFAAAVETSFGRRWTEAALPHRPGDVVQLPGRGGGPTHAAVCVDGVTWMHATAEGVRRDPWARLAPHAVATWRSLPDEAPPC